MVVDRRMTGLGLTIAIVLVSTKNASVRDATPGERHGGLGSLVGTVHRVSRAGLLLLDHPQLAAGRVGWIVGINALELGAGVDSNLDALTLSVEVCEHPILQGGGYGVRDWNPIAYCGWKRRETMWCEVMVELKRRLKCDNTARRKWDHVGRRKAKKQGRKEYAGLTRWGNRNLPP